MVLNEYGDVSDKEWKTGSLKQRMSRNQVDGVVEKPRT